MKSVFNFIIYLLFFLNFVTFSQINIQNYFNSSTIYSSDTDSLILNIVKEINKDSVYSWIKGLQDFKTRFALAPDKDTVANWIKNQFLRLGFKDVEIDTFTTTVGWSYNVLSLQKNIIATLKGTVDTNQVFIIGGHYDSANQEEDPLIIAPGADDNASGTASVLESARVIMKKGYRPNFTIKFIAYAGEESCKPSGSYHFARTLHEKGKDVRLAINSDMISNTTKPLESSTIQILYNPNYNLFYKYLSAEMADKLTVLNVKSLTDIVGADNGEYSNYKIPTIDFVEDEFSSKYYHSSNDLVEHYNMEYCAEVIKIACATLIAAIETNSYSKSIYKITAEPEWHQIKIKWQPDTKAGVAGFNIYKGISPNEEKQKLNSVLFSDTFYIDNQVKNGIYYYYEVRCVDSAGIESILNKTIKSRAVSLDQGILVVDETIDGDGTLMKPSDEEVDNFYSDLLENFNKKEYDNLKDGNPTLADIGAFSTVIWQGDDYSNLQLNKSIDDIKKYLNYGGKLIISSFFLTQSLDNTGTYPKEYTSGNFIYDYLKIKKADYKFGSRFSWAISLSTEYPSIFIDTSKILPNYKNHLIDIESIEAAPDGKEIYRYDSKYDSTSQQGRMKGLPIGVEYIGDDFKTISLSFPLYYMDNDQVKELIQYLMLNKFHETTGVGESKVNTIPTELGLYQNYPNPFNPITTINFELSKAGFVKLKIFDILGRQIAILVNEEKEAGSYDIEFDASNFPSGIYIYTVEFNSIILCRKMILLK